MNVCIDWKFALAASIGTGAGAALVILALKANPEGANMVLTKFAESQTNRKLNG